MTYPPRSDDTELRRDGEAPERIDDENDDNGPVDPPEDPELRRTVDTRDPDAPHDSDDSADEPGDDEPAEPGEGMPEDPELRRDVETPADEVDEDEEDEDEEDEGDEPPPADPTLRRDFETPGAVEEPAPQPTAFGAATVGGAAAAAALAQPGPRSDRTTVGDSPVTEDLDRPGGDGAVPDHAVGVASVDEVRAATPDTAERDEAPAAAEEPLTRDEPVAAEEPVGLLPGQAESEAAVALWDGDTIQTYRERWRELQLRFVDDPEGATGEAQSLVGEAVDALTSSLVEQRTDLDGWRSGQSGDTEHLRVALRRYRDFFDRLMNL